jgi:uncharacterized DUF497 family protein
VTPIRFDWDPAKADSNRAKHGVSFDEAMLVFADPLSVSRLDDEQGRAEERWVTLGRTRVGRLTLVVHTYDELNDGTIAIRVISARRPTRHEMREYEEG